MGCSTGTCGCKPQLDFDYKWHYKNTRENYRELISRVDKLLTSEGAEHEQMKGILKASIPHIKEYMEELK
tara:strand:- start:472 stop:681 length:210 start_codon:yes stop_codon:yes gene_type:complete